jgi:hypothetical protein
MLRAAGVALVSVSVSASVPSTATVKRVPSMSILSKEPDELLFNGVQGGGPVRAPIFRAGFHVAAAAIGIPETLAPAGFERALPPPEGDSGAVDQRWHSLDMPAD